MMPVRTTERISGIKVQNICVELIKLLLQKDCLNASGRNKVKGENLFLLRKTCKLI